MTHGDLRRAVGVPMTDREQYKAEDFRRVAIALSKRGFVGHRDIILTALKIAAEQAGEPAAVTDEMREAGAEAYHEACEAERRRKQDLYAAVGKEAPRVVLSPSVWLDDVFKAMLAASPTPPAKKAECPECKGTGRVFGPNPICSFCGGVGYIESSASNAAIAAAIRGGEDAS